ncbi:MAG: peptidoglycan-binding protein [Coriobacteriia bacterium]|nr:peptidoglycan-binding protein [Coriobacteriia bacterium]
MVQPIVQGDRGSAVEDVQKRLLMLGFDLGPTGVDGVFLGSTLTAVREFQHEHELDEDGVVGDETWAALVDATFRLGDRLLYLKLPYLHGADVRALQGALNVLGFACGGPDGIFGAFTERAVGEFQANVGLPVDGIAGPETIRAMERLRHVWHGKDPASPVALVPAPARAAEVLRGARVVLECTGECACAVAERVVNLARATEAGANVSLSAEGGSSTGALVLSLVCGAPQEAAGRTPVIVMGPDCRSEGRFIAAFEAAPRAQEAIVVLPDMVSRTEHGMQGIAVRVLDGVCAVLSGRAGSVLP